jgi:hypothetical protein
MGTDNKKIRRAILTGEVRRVLGADVKPAEHILIDAVHPETGDEHREVMTPKTFDGRTGKRILADLARRGFDVEVHDGRDLW